MKNINKWDSLSIKDKADLMKLYTKNGINNLEEIRSHYNKFATGGNTEEEENTVLTREEYITQRLEEARLKALEKSRTRTIPKSPIIINEESEEEHNAKRKLFTENIGKLQDRLKQLETQKALGIFVDKQIDNTKKNIKTYQDWLSKPYEKYKKGASCIYTATDNYGNEYLVSGNKTFASNPQKYGFKKIEKTKIEPGDLVQDVSQGYPSHAMIYNGKNESGFDTFNYSRGGDSEVDIVKGGIYKQNAPLDVFRFVGTAKDSAQYINDYNKLYGNKFEDGGEKNTLGVPWASLNSSKYDYFNASKDNMPKEKNGHWTSRNSSGRILKSPEHPTIDVALNMEGILGNKIYKNIDGTYSSYEENQFPTSFGIRINNYEYGVSPLDPNKRFKGIKTTKGRKYNEDNITYISDKLNNTLLNEVQKNAILGSIIEESGGNPFAVDETGKFKGLLQWEDSRYSPNDSLSEREEIDNQLQYLIETLYNIEDRKSWTHGGKGSGYKSSKHARDSFLNTNDLYEAVHALNRGYIRPTGGDYSVKNRYNVAKQIK